MLVHVLIFRETSILVFTVSVPIYTPINSTQGFSCLHILVTTLSLVFLDGSHSNRYEVMEFVVPVADIGVHQLVGVVGVRTGDLACAEYADGYIFGHDSAPFWWEFFVVYSSFAM